MKKRLLLLLLLAATFYTKAQNVGIGTTTPQFPLSFPSVPGDKISLWADGSATHYGFGIQGGLLQMFAKNDVDDIAFGHGSSNAFIERMRIKYAGSHGTGMELNGRIFLRNGTDPLDIGYGPGIWLNKADNSALLSFMGTQNNQNVGFYGGPAGWGFTYDAVNSRVGIGTVSPATSLEINGYTKLGSGAPSIKVKKLTGSTDSYEGGISIIAHGLALSKILSVSVMVARGAGDFWVGPNFEAENSNFRWEVNSSHVYIHNVFGSSNLILFKPFKVLITYEE